MILFLRSSDIGIDSRLRRYCHALRETGLGFAALYWDRDGKAVGDTQIPSFRYRAKKGYGSRLATALHLIGLNLFALMTMLRIRKTLRLVHAVDLDTAATAWLFHKLSGIPFIYDIYDSYPDSRGIQGWKRRPFDWIERRVIRSAALVILADESRTAQHAPIDPERLLVIENVPDVPAYAGKCAVQKGERLRVGYLGTLEAHFRGIEHMLSVVEADAGLELYIGGTGALADDVRDAAALCPRIRYYGAMQHEAGLAMLADCDVVMGLYYAEVPNHRFAAPNKYYEHLVLGKPMLTSLGTPPGTKVVTHDTGWAVADGAAGITQALTEARANTEGRLRKEANARALWRNGYADYFQRVIKGHYATCAARLIKPHNGTTDLNSIIASLLPFAC